LVALGANKAEWMFETVALHVCSHVGNTCSSVCPQARQPGRQPGRQGRLLAVWWDGFQLLLHTALPGAVLGPCRQWHRLLLCACCQASMRCCWPQHTACIVTPLHLSLWAGVFSSCKCACFLWFNCFGSQARCNLNCTGSSKGRWVHPTRLQQCCAAACCHILFVNFVTKSSQPNIGLLLSGFGLPGCTRTDGQQPLPWGVLHGFPCCQGINFAFASNVSLAGGRWRPDK
jgi:hypothetical protein